MRCSFIKHIVATSLLCFSLQGFANQTDSSAEQETKVITPDASPVVQHGFNVFVTADFIYWTGRLDNLSYATTGLSQAKNTVNPNFIVPQGMEYSPDHKMSPGFKGGIGLDLRHDGWDTYFQYTYFHTSASHFTPFSSHAASTWNYADGCIFTQGTTSISSARCNWYLHFNAIDWELGRNYYISPKLLLRPLIGLKGSWQKQSLTISQFELRDTQALAFDPLVYDQLSQGSYTSAHEQNFWGLGPRAGVNTSWQFNKNWSFFADTAVSALWSQFVDKRADTVSQAPTNTVNEITTALTNISTVNIEKRLHTLRPVLELQLGVRWDYWFLDNDYRVRLQAGWEQQVWFDQNQFIEIHEANRYGSLNLQGLTLAFRLDF